MKYKYKAILLLAVGTLSVTASAQKDTTLTRQVMLEREYTPTLQNANRINTNPSIYEHQVKRVEVDFINQAPIMVFPHNKLGAVPSGDIGTDIPHSLKRGYLQMGVGTRANVQAAAGYKLMDKETDQLDIFGTYYSTNGDVNYAEKGYISDKMKAKYSDIKAKLKYKHFFEPSILSLFASYSGLGYNYYGNSFIPTIMPNPYSYDYTTKQKTDVFSFGAGLKSSETNGGMLKYEGKVSYDLFKNKYGLVPEDEGMKGGIINVNVDLYAEISADNFAGVRTSVMNQSFSNSAQNLKDTLHGLTNFAVNPYYRIEGAGWSTELGLNASALFDQENKFFVSPNLRASVDLDHVNTIYGIVTGGVNNNHFLDILQENRYASPLGRIKYSKTQYDIQIGFKSGAVPGFEFDIFGGHKNTKDDHLYIASPMATLANSQWGNVGLPAYATISTGHAGAMVKTHLIPYTTLWVKGVGYFYNVKDIIFNDIESYNITDKKAWGRPAFTAELNMDIQPIEHLTISGNYLLSTGRKTFSKGETVKMKDVSELNAKAEYQLTDWFSINVRANNILNQKYDLVYGYTLQGFNALGGLNFKF